LEKFLFDKYGLLPYNGLKLGVRHGKKCGENGSIGSTNSLEAEKDVSKSIQNRGPNPDQLRAQIGDRSGSEGYP
jgi:hypothetical protein